LEIDKQNAPAASVTGNSLVLRELITELMRKGILDDEVGRGMFQHLDSVN
jgi:hypothetical protein